jgi:hypothetical protein
VVSPAVCARRPFFGFISFLAGLARKILWLFGFFFGQVSSVGVVWVKLAQFWLAWLARKVSFWHFSFSFWAFFWLLAAGFVVKLAQFSRQGYCQVIHGFFGLRALFGAFPSQVVSPAKSVLGHALSNSGYPCPQAKNLVVFSSGFARGHGKTGPTLRALDVANATVRRAFGDPVFYRQIGFVHPPATPVTPAVGLPLA